MPCMCGDFCCNSCGPAQGNRRCYVCGEWESDGGCAEPEKCKAEEAKLAAEEREIAARIEESEAEYLAHFREHMEARAIEEKVTEDTWEDEDDAP